MAMRLAGKVALISGAARGMGAAHAELFIAEGAAVVIGDVLKEEGRAVAEALGPRAVYTYLDVRRIEDWSAAVAAAEERFGKLDILVNNAGVLSMPGILDISLDEWDKVIAINQTGVFLGMREAIPALRRAGGGSIVNISSIWGVAGAADNIAYQASKGAVLAMTRSAALTHAQDGIRANSIVPGLVSTPMVAEEPPEVHEEVIGATPLGRAANANEISPGVLFLASNDSSYVTGTTLTIDGGYLAQ